MHNNLIFSTKKKALDLLNRSISANPKFRDIAKAYNSFHGSKERPQVGVRINSSSGTRLKQSPDDALAELFSLAVLLPFPQKPNASIDWVWENTRALCVPVKLEDVTSRLTPDRTRLIFDDKTLVMGPGTPVPAKGYGPVTIYAGGRKMMHQASPNAVDFVGVSIPPGVQVLASYTYLDGAPPAFYIVEILQPESEGHLPDFVVRPLFTVEGEVLIEKTSGLETDVQLKATSNVLTTKGFLLYTQTTQYSVKRALQAGVDYEVTSEGLITFLQPLPSNTYLFATYRYYGDVQGPFKIPHEHYACTEAIKGVTIAFGEGLQAGDTQIVGLLPKRERVANVRGSHFEMNIDITVFARDPISSAELCDHLIGDIWGNHRNTLSGQGFTILDMEPGGESTESYNDSTGDLYFTNSVSFRVMVEWHKITPYIQDVQGFDVSIFQVEEFTDRQRQASGTETPGGAVMSRIDNTFFLSGKIETGPALI